MTEQSLCLVRHGDTVATELSRVCGRSDPPLSPRGRRAVEQLGRLSTFRQITARVRRIWTSPSARALETLALIERSSGLECHESPHVDDRLMELDFGDWEGLPWDTVHQRWPEALAHWSDDWVHRSPPGGESFEALAARLASWLREWRADGTPSLVVTHGGCIQALGCLLLEQPLREAMRRRVDTASLHHYGVNRESGRGRQRQLNIVG